MRISHLECFCLVLISKKLVLFAENERPANKLKSTNRHQETNYKILQLIDLTNILCGFHWVVEPISLHVKISYL